MADTWQPNLLTDPSWKRRREGEEGRFGGTTNKDKRNGGKGKYR
jgi:hypothetical protein